MYGEEERGQILRLLCRFAIGAGKPTGAKLASACLAFPGPQANARILELGEKLDYSTILVVVVTSAGRSMARTSQTTFQRTGRRIACVVQETALLPVQVMRT